jgi:hypothetical protein
MNGAKGLLATVVALGATLDLLACTSSSVLVADETVPVFSRNPSSYPIQNSTLTTLSKGQRVKIKDTRYAKDFMYHEVILADGRHGYVIYMAGSFHVEK